MVLQMDLKQTHIALYIVFNPYFEHGQVEPGAQVLCQSKKCVLKVDICNFSKNTESLKVCF